MLISANAKALLSVLAGLALFGCQRNMPPTPARIANGPVKSQVDTAAHKSKHDGQQVSFDASSPTHTAESETRQYPSTGIEFWDPLVIANRTEKSIDNGRTSVTPDEERQAIAVAKEHLKKDSDKSIETEFKVVRADCGYHVFVHFFGRDEQGQPVTTVGAHCLVEISLDWKVVKVIGGL